MKSYTCPHCSVRYVNSNADSLESMVRVHLLTHKDKLGLEHHKKLFCEYRSEKKKKKKRDKQKQALNNNPKATASHIKNLEQRNKRLEREKNELQSKLLKLSKDLDKKRSKHPFYDSDEWRRLKYRALKTYGTKCMACKATNVIMHVDHIKPRSKYPELELEFNNLQVLCESCNLGKSNLDETDWRPHKRGLS